MELIHLRLKREEAEFLGDVLDYWTGEMEVATSDTISEAPCKTVEELLTLAAGMDEQKTMTSVLRMKITEGLTGVNST